MMIVPWVLRSFFKNKIRLNNYSLRQLSVTNLKCQTQEDMKSTVSILNNEADSGLMINAYSEVGDRYNYNSFFDKFIQVGFRLNNDFTILGPMVIFPKSVLSWNVSSTNDITEESLSLFTILEPKIDLIIIGIGDYNSDKSFQKLVFPFLHKYKMNVEILPTHQACATFNFLNSEGRYIAGALLPPSKIDSTENDLLQTKLRYQNLYEVND